MEKFSESLSIIVFSAVTILVIINAFLRSKPFSINTISRCNALNRREDEINKESLFHQINHLSNFSNYMKSIDRSRSKMKLTPITVWDHFNPIVSCPDIYRVGNIGDGGKWVCGWRDLMGRDNCNVYSFGISGDLSFEIEVLLKTRCLVYAFDPTVINAHYYYSTEAMIKLRL